MSIIPQRKEIRKVPAFDDLNMVIFGLQKTGKTSFLSGDTNSVTVACEPGSDFVACRPVEVNDFQTFAEVLKAVKKNPKDVSALVIDTVDVLYDYCLQHVCKKQNLSYPRENDFGRTWNDIRKTWEHSLTFALRCTRLRFISHEAKIKDSAINDEGLREDFEKTIQRFHGNKARFIDATVNCVGYMSVSKSGTRLLNFNQTSLIAAGDRTGVLGKLGTIRLPKDASKGFAHVSNLYREKAIELGFEVENRFNSIK